MKALVILVALELLATGCAARSLAWPIDDATTSAGLREKYREQRDAVERDDVCRRGDPLRAGFGWSACERLKQQVWDDYWRARRDLADLKGWK